MRSNSPGRNRRRRSVRSAPVCEGVEPRVLLSTYMVTNTDDTGAGSLRAGMEFADENAGVTPTVIDFNIPGEGVHTIKPLSPLPTVGSVLIDGYSQPGAQPNTLGVGDNAVLKIELDGSTAGDGPGLELINGAEVRGLMINRFAGHPAILADPTPETFGSQFQALVTVDGNFIGTNAAGNAGFAQNNGPGIDARGDCLIGGTAADGINVISGNAGDGVVFSGGGANTPGNVVEGNYVGTDATGTTALPNGQSGVHCSAFSLSVVKNNLISGNTGPGITIDGSFNDISSNRIGVSAPGAGGSETPLPNGKSGVTIFGKFNTIELNTIAFNHGAGIVDLSGVPINAGEVNSFTANSIYGNTGLGIDLGGDGVTPNTPGGPRNSANHLTNYPVLAYAASGVGGTVVSGTVNDLPWIIGAQIQVEFFLNPKADPSGYGQEQTYLGHLVLPVDADGNASFSFTLNNPLPVGQFVSATATVVVLPSPGQSFPPALYGTSEFSADVKVGLMGDVNGDGKVDFGDLLILARNYGKPGTPDQGDGDGDGKIDFGDLVLLARNYGSETSNGQQAPSFSPAFNPDGSAVKRLKQRRHSL